MAQSEKKQTALVTGASSGIGKELATLFAAHGHDVVLVARTVPRLEALATELTNAHGVRAHVLASDLAEEGAPAMLAGELQSRGLSIDFLVNNAGFGSNGAFLDLNGDRELEMIDVNVRALVALTQLLGRPMRERGFGRILNIASTAGFQPGPFMATYYATKAFVLSFSEALAVELHGSGVTVTAHCPGATTTEFAEHANLTKSRLFQRKTGIADAKSVAVHAYDAMMSGRVVSVHGAANWLGTQGVRLAPRAVIRKIAGNLNRPAS